MRTFNNLSEHGFAMVDYPSDLRAKVEQASESWQDFCSLPIQQKQLYEASNHSAGTGWEQDDEGLTGSPNRENFDITAGYQGAGSNVHPFVDAGTQLAESVQSFISDAAKDIEHEYGMHDFSENVQRSTVFLRFLHYFGNPTTGDVIAEPHTDQSGFTLHLSETDHGCERMDPKSRQWSSMPVEDGKAVLFGAMQLQLLTDCEIPALTHRVVATEKTKIAGRFAIVAFVRIANVPVYNKTAHGRLQERMPGFQYDMKPNEFAELFVARHN